jgi:DNA excision repair protein ERCC-5
MRDKLEIPNGFPSDEVVQAYLHPEIDPSDESFAWVLPDLDAIRTYLC